MTARVGLDRPATARVVSGRQRAGLVLAILNAVVSLPSGLTAPDDVAEPPPLGILVLDSALAVVALVSAGLAWRGSRAALRVCAVAIVLNALTGLPALFVPGLPMGTRLLVALGLLWALAVVLLVYPGRGTHPGGSAG